MIHKQFCAEYTAARTTEEALSRRIVELERTITELRGERDRLTNKVMAVLELLRRD